MFTTRSQTMILIWATKLKNIGISKRKYRECARDVVGRNWFDVLFDDDDDDLLANAV